MLDLPAQEGSSRTVVYVLLKYTKKKCKLQRCNYSVEADASNGYDISPFALQVDDRGVSELVTTDATDLDASTQGELADRVNQTPEREGYTGYIIGDGLAPNGEVFGSGISFPTSSVEGDYFLRIDMLPNRLFRYDGKRWVKMEDNVRMTMTGTDNKQTQKGTFINNTNEATIGGETVKERQGT